MTPSQVQYMETKTLSSRPVLFVDGLSYFEETNRERLAAVLITRDKELIPEVSKKLAIYLRGKASNIYENTLKRSNPWGRFYGKGLANMNCESRNTAIRDLYYDLDIRCCAYSLLSFVLAKDYPTVRFSYIDEVAKNRDNLIKQYGTSKKHYNVMLFYEDAVPRNDFDRGLKDDVARAHDLIRKSNRVLSDFVKRRKAKDPSMGSFLSYYTQEVETRLMSSVIEYLWNCTELLDDPVSGNKVFAYEYDGIKILRRNVQDIDQVLAQINGFVRDELGFKGVEFVDKPMNKFFELSEEDMEKGRKYLESLEVVPTELMDMASMLGRMDVTVALLLDKYYKGRIVHQFNVWYFFDGCKWNRFEKTPHLLKKMLPNMIRPLGKELLIRYEELKPVSSDPDDWSPAERAYHTFDSRFQNLKSRLDDNKELREIIDYMRSYFNDESIQFDRKPFLLGFNNGVYDLEKDEFREHRYEDYLTMSVGYDFVTHRNPELEKEVNDVLGKVQTDPERRTFLLTVLATGLCGLCVESFHIFNGNGRNGKGFIDEFVMRTLGDEYGYYAEPALVTKEMGSVSGPNPQVANISKKRLIICKEPEPGARITSFYKSITGGGKLNARKCHSNDTTVHQDCTLCIECNTRPLFKETPQMADEIRIKDILFDSNFMGNVDDYKNKIFIPDPRLKTTEWQDAHRMSFMWILIEHFKLFRDTDYRIDLLVPESVRLRSKKYLEQNNPICSVWDMALVATNDPLSALKLSEVVKHLKFVARIEGFTDIQCRQITRDTVAKHMIDTGLEGYNKKEAVLYGHNLVFE